MPTPVDIDVHINAAESARTMGELRSSLRNLVALQGQVGEAGSQNFRRLQQAINDAEGRVGDLTDSFQTLRGSGVERVNASLGLFQQGLQNADPTQLRIGLQGLGAAMSAIPILLVVQGIQFLAEKFNIFGKIADFVTGLVNNFTDALGFTTVALEKQTQKLIENTEKQSKTIQARYDAEIQYANAAGMRTTELEIKKAKDVEENAKLQFGYIQNLNKQKKQLSDEEKKQYEELQAALLKATADRIAKEASQLKEFKDIVKNADSDLARTRLQGAALEIYTIQKESEAQIKELDKLAARVVQNEEAYKQYEAARAQISQEAAIKIGRITAEENEKLKALWATRAAEFNRLLGLQQEAAEQNSAAQIADEQAANQKLIQEYTDQRDFKLALKEGEAEQNQQIDAANRAKQNNDLRNQVAFEKAFAVQSSEERIKAIERDRDTQLANQQLTEDQRIKIIQDSENKIKAIRLSSAQQIVGYTQQALASLTEINAAITANENQELAEREAYKNAAQENQRNRTQEEIDREIAATNAQLNNDALSADQRERIRYDSETRIQNIQQRSAAAQIRSNKDFAKQELEIKKQQFQRQKTLQIITGVVNTAASVLQTLAGTPYPANIPLAIAAGAAGAIQVGIIASQEFSDGVSNAASSVTPAASIDTRGGFSAPSSGFNAPNISSNGNTTSAVQTELEKARQQKIYVLESDIRGAMNNVDVYESRATLGE